LLKSRALILFLKNSGLFFEALLRLLISLLKPRRERHKINTGIR